MLVKLSVVDTCDDGETAFTVPIANRTVLFCIQRRTEENGRKAKKEKQTKINVIAGRTGGNLNESR